MLSFQCDPSLLFETDTFESNLITESGSSHADTEGFNGATDTEEKCFVLNRASSRNQASLSRTESHSVDTRINLFLTNLFLVKVKKMHQNISKYYLKPKPRSHGPVRGDDPYGGL